MHSRMHDNYSHCPLTIQTLFTKFHDTKSDSYSHTHTYSIRSNHLILTFEFGLSGTNNAFSFILSFFLHVLL